MEDRLQLQYEGLLTSSQLDLLGTTEIGMFDFDQLGLSATPLNGLVKHYRLGRRVEFLFEHYINCSSRYELLISNLQVQGVDRTIGELDFIISDKANSEVIHLELAYKFYCYDESVSSDELSRWIGPNRKDSLVEKLDKLVKRQFPLIETSETKNLLSINNIDKITKQQLCLFTQLFIPEASVSTSYTHINKDCIVGYWITMDRFLEDYFQEQQFWIPEKQDWLIDVSSHSLWRTYADVKEEIVKSATSGFSILIWIKTHHSNKAHKFFVVGQDWSLDID